jgi:hypothetical protein
MGCVFWDAILCILNARLKQKQRLFEGRCGVQADEAACKAIV